MLATHTHTHTLLLMLPDEVPLFEENKGKSCYKRAFVLSEMGLYVMYKL